VTRESAPKGALTIASARQDQHQSSSEPVVFGGFRGPLPLLDLAEYADRFAALGHGCYGMEDAETLEVLGTVLERIADSLRYVLKGAA
jgi:hypothetical protein